MGLIKPFVLGFVIVTVACPSACGRAAAPGVGKANGGGGRWFGRRDRGRLLITRVLIS
jgi:hypothetical protein